jgi:hypothetical protein
MSSLIVRGAPAKDSKNRLAKFLGKPLDAAVDLGGLHVEQLEMIMDDKTALRMPPTIS